MLRDVRPLMLLALFACAGGSDTDCEGEDCPSDDTEVQDGTTDTETDTEPCEGEDCASDTEETDTEDPDAVYHYTCDDTLTYSSEDSCVFTDNGGEQVLLRGALVLGADAEYTYGQVLIEDDQILCVGCYCDKEADLDASTLDCAEGVISPGLINPHDHITYTEGEPISTSSRYDHRHDWRGSLSTPSNSSDYGEAWGEIRMVMGGTTSMVGSGSVDGMVRNLDDDGANEGLSAAEVNNQTFPLGDSNEQFQDDCDWNYRDYEDEVAYESSYVPHVAEGIDDYAVEEFYCMSNGEYGEDLTEQNTAHVHSVGLGAEEYMLMATDGAQIVWSPRSNISLYGDTAQVPVFHRLGGTIALGTDWTYSGSMTTYRELACAAELNEEQWGSYFSDRELWEMATVNGAIALGAEDEIGSLASGMVADIAIFEGDSYRAIIDADATSAVLVLRGGEPLYGKPDLVDALGRSCEEIDVCGETRAICAKDEFGADYDKIEDDVDAYPAFFCDGPPDDEPSCDPYRPGEYDGATSSDADGDGVEDSADNCPDHFNPIRPMDDGEQRDADGDGVGDICDDTPLGTDYDGDGTLNEDDNCPLDANADQADADEDGRGDVCDWCPETANPDGGCPYESVSVSIEDVQDGTYGEGEAVSITGAIVTAVDSSGFYAQNPDSTDGEYAGVYAYAGGDPGVEVGDEVDFTGTITEYYDLTEVEVVEWSVTGTGTVTPFVIDVADAETEVYEGVLVTITGEVSDEAYDCSVDGSSCSDADLFEIDEALVAYDRCYEDSNWTANMPGDGETVTITGVMGYRFERRRLMPRTAADFE